MSAKPGMNFDKPHVTIRCRPGRALLACQLGKSGYRVDLYEKRPDPREHSQSRADPSIWPSPFAACKFGEVGLPTGIAAAIAMRAI